MGGGIKIIFGVPLNFVWRHFKPNMEHAKVKVRFLKFVTKLEKLVERMEKNQKCWDYFERNGLIELEGLTQNKHNAIEKKILCLVKKELLFYDRLSPYCPKAKDFKEAIEKCVQESGVQLNK
jgi:hypothetical protein